MSSGTSPTIAKMMVLMLFVMLFVPLALFISVFPDDIHRAVSLWSAVLVTIVLVNTTLFSLYRLLDDQLQY